MAAPTVLTNATIWYGGYDLIGATNEITMNAASAEKPVSRFGDTVEATYPGAMTVGVEAKGFWDSALDGPQFTQLTAPSESWPLTICPTGADDTELAYGIQAYSFNYSALESQWGQSLPYRVSARARSGSTLARGSVLLPKGTRTSQTESAHRLLGAVSATQKLVATLHVFAIDGGGSWAPFVMSDPDAAPAGHTARVTFAPVTTAPTQQVIKTNGPITDTYWFAFITKTGGTSLTAAMTLAIVDA